MQVSSEAAALLVECETSFQPFSFNALASLPLVPSPPKVLMRVACGGPPLVAAVVVSLCFVDIANVGCYRDAAAGVVVADDDVDGTPRGAVSPYPHNLRTMRRPACISEMECSCFTDCTTQLQHCGLGTQETHELVFTPKSPIRNALSIEEWVDFETCSRAKILQVVCTTCRPC